MFSSLLEQIFLLVSSPFTFKIPEIAAEVQIKLVPNW